MRQERRIRNLPLAVRTGTSYRNGKVRDTDDDTIESAWRQYGWVDHTQVLLDSFRRWVGRDLIPRDGTAEEQARKLFLAPIVVVSHGTEADPIVSYGNRAALGLWEMEIETLLRTPSRLTAEPVHRDERARLLERTSRDGFVDDYSGIRISSSGRRFYIERATVWNLVDAAEEPVGQAAAFEDWTLLEE